LASRFYNSLYYRTSRDLTFCPESKNNDATTNTTEMKWVQDGD